MIRHALPYGIRSAACLCPVQTCGGIISDPDCPDHGTRREPAMEWHEAGGARCRALSPSRYRCSRGHFLPADFRPPATERGDWDDTCRHTPTA